MFSFVLFLFCADPVDRGNNLFYRSGPPPVAARADGVDQAKIFMNALSATITSSSALPKLVGYTVLAGQTLFAADKTTVLGSVLKVSGWRVFVAKTRLEAVTKTMVDSLLGMFAQEKAEYEKLSSVQEKTASAEVLDDAADEKKETNQGLAYSAIDSASGSLENKKKAKAEFDKLVSTGKSPTEAWKALMTVMWTKCISNAKKAYPAIQAPNFQ